MKTKLLLLGVMTIGCSSGCMATLHPDGTMHAHYYVPPVVVEEPVVFVPGPKVIVARPHHRVVYSRPVRHRSHTSHGHHKPSPHRPSHRI